MYHHIGLPSKGEKDKKLWVSAEKFSQQMVYLKKHGFTPITFQELQNGHIPAKPVIITFDDGRKNNYCCAFPILKEFGFKACMFLIAGQLEINPDQLEQMQDSGIEFGCHTTTHPNLLQISEDNAREEITDSKKILEEQLNSAIIAFAYPYGQGAYDEKSRQMVKEAGYSFACGIKQGKVSLPITDPYCLRRLLVRGDDLMIDFILNLKKGRSRL